MERFAYILLGFVLCFVTLFLMGRLQKYLAVKAIASMATGTNEKVRQGERIVAVLNPGTSQKLVIDTLSGSLWSKLKSFFRRT